MITNGQITLVYAFLTPIARFGGLFFAGYAVAMLASLLAAPWLFIDLNKLASIQSVPIKYVALVLIAFLPLLAYDFFYYLFHRLQHANSWLWEQHKLHHSDGALNVTTSFRINWMEEFFKSLLVSVPAALVLNIQPAQVGLLASIVGAGGQIWGQYLHSNIRISLGTPFVTGPQFHRIHHSVETHHQNKNFSTYLPVWDKSVWHLLPPF